MTTCSKYISNICWWRSQVFYLTKNIGTLLGPDKTTQAIQVTSITASPHPLVAPGPLHLSFSGKVLKPIPVFLLEFDFKRHILFGQTIHVPCVGGIGSWYVMHYI